MTWHRVSPRYVWVDFVGNLVSVLIVIAVGLFLAFVVIDDPAPWLLPAFAAGALALFVYALFGIRRVRAIGYQLRQDDLLFRRGIMFSRTVAVPYGRMQLIDIQRGPLLRALGLTNLKFVTAAAATDVVLPGLVDADASELRDRLVALAETRRSGL
ncbi:PH domain-containing protein [Leucobacter sp. M11]|uniref:PH domain-containing protein n=1 Tax=Leucobacter sp. M11 TaxID=2993565 RepID=UPI002D936227|nr:PH domain-containing protein [Leucobacter sp. M11]